MQQYPVDSVSLHVHRVHPTVSHLQSVYTEFIQQYPMDSQSTQSSSTSIPWTVSLHRVHPTVSHLQSVYTEVIQQYPIYSQSTQSSSNSIPWTVSLHRVHPTVHPTVSDRQSVYITSQAYRCSCFDGYRHLHSSS